MTKGYLLGYDLNESYGQISYYNHDKDEPTTLDVAADNCQIPLVLAFFNERWVFGREARRLETINQGVAFTDFFAKARSREKISADGKSYDAVWLLAKFIQLTLTEYEDIAHITFTVPETDVDMLNLLQGIGQHMGIAKERITVQDYKESFCHYMNYQPKELWQYEAALFYCDDDQMKAYMLRRLNSERRTNDLFVTVDEVGNAHLAEFAAITPFLELDPEQARSADARFKSFIQGVFDKKVVSSVFLTGDGFEQEWYPDSLKVLCNGRRAFLGNNLYSKGACYYSYRLAEEPAGGSVYLDPTRLMQRICLHLRVGGKEQWYPIVPWGTHWYEADTQLEVILEEAKDLEIHVESLANDDLQVEKISLEGLPERKDYSLRLRIELMFLDERTCRFTIRDVGFGDFFPPSDFSTEKLIDLGGINGQFNSMS